MLITWYVRDGAKRERPWICTRRNDDATSAESVEHAAKPNATDSKHAIAAKHYDNISDSWAEPNRTQPRRESKRTRVAERNRRCDSWGIGQSESENKSNASGPSLWLAEGET